MSFNNYDRLTICYNAWMIFHENDDYDFQLAQIAERGFNCIRIEDGAGLIWDKDGNVRDDVLICSPFGKFTEHTPYRVLAIKNRINVLDRLLRVCRAAKKHGVKVILSSWFFLHTNWFCEEKDKKPLFDLPTREKLSFFADELDRILDVLKKEDLIDIVAFAEIFNEFDGMIFVEEYFGGNEEIIRDMHEEEIAKLKSKHPDVLFAFDTCNTKVKAELIPRNIDVLNFHCYYLWPVYYDFEKDIIKPSLEEPTIPEETRYYLKDKLVTVKEVADAMGGNIQTGLDWPRRISLYLSIDENKMAELDKYLDNNLKSNIEFYKSKFKRGIERILNTHKQVVPNSRLVMGEGGSYCASPTLTFERDSETFWQLLCEQMEYLKSLGCYGSVLSTTHAPFRVSAWEPCKDLYLKANNIFLDKD